MELELIRTYFPNGTNGELFFNGARVCNSIELAWNNNQNRISCIPEGKYELKKRYSQQHGWHLQVMKVKNRDLILIHAANDARKELKGCIAPVSILTAEGKGLGSRIAKDKLQSIVFPVLETGKKVFLLIKSELHEAD
ncbi:MAG: DUF5675 family protein [Ferruginibacter sp.]